MLSRSLPAGALALLAATVSCTTGEGDDEATVETSPEVPLDLTVDQVDIAHGSLRLSATMREGSADVSVTVGKACSSTEVGRGMANRSTFVWALGEDEVALAMKCDLVVRARVREETGVVVKSASLSVSPLVASSDTDEGPQLQGTSSSENGVILAFGSGELSVSQVDFARSVVMRRPLAFEGASFDTSVSVAGVELEAEADKTAEPETAEAPEAERSGPEPSIVSN
jgi:hypothetical protein